MSARCARLDSNNVLGPVKSNEFTGLIQKSLECHGIRMGGFDSKKLTGTRADHSNDIHPQMVAIFCHPGFATFTVSSASGWALGPLQNRTRQRTRHLLFHPEAGCGASGGIFRVAARPGGPAMAVVP